MLVMLPDRCPKVVRGPERESISIHAIWQGRPPCCFLNRLALKGHWPFHDEFGDSVVRAPIAAQVTKVSRILRDNRVKELCAVGSPMEVKSSNSLRAF